MAELRHLRYFVAVAEELHFGRAAKRVHVAQPSLSRQIRDLEAEIGARLFVRNRRGVSLTEAGSELLGHARTVIDRLGLAFESARRAARGDSGLLRVAYVPTMAVTRLAATVRAFRRLHPAVTIVLREAWPDAQQRQLLRGDIDLGFARGPIAEPGLDSEVALEEEIVVALPAGHRLASKRVLSLRALAAEPFVVPDRLRGSGFHDQVVALCRSAGFSPRAVQDAAHLEFAVAVASGAGVALVPESIRSFGRAGLVFRSLRERPTTQVLMVWPRTSSSAALHKFLAHLRAGTAARANG
jgi:DNA-binding transcriptional LysR family regulator